MAAVVRCPSDSDVGVPQGAGVRFQLHHEHSRYRGMIALFESGACVPTVIPSNITLGVVVEQVPQAWACP